MSAAVLSRIPGLCERQLRGWCRAVFEWRIREPFPGEVAALFDRAKALGIDVNSLPVKAGNGRKETGEEGATNANLALDIADLERRPDHAR